MESLSFSLGGSPPHLGVRATLRRSRQHRDPLGPVGRVSARPATRGLFSQCWAGCSAAPPISSVKSPAVSCLDVTYLPYNPEVLNWVQQERPCAQLCSLHGFPLKKL